MVKIKKYSKFVFIFSFFVICFLFNTSNVRASETENYNNNSNLTEEEKIFWEKIDAGLFYSPIHTNFAYGSGSTLSFTGGHYMLAYKSSIFSDYSVYTMGNQVYQTYNDAVSAYAVQGTTYGFDNNHQLFREFGVFDLPYGYDLSNVILSNGFMTDIEAKDFAVNYQSRLSDESFLVEHNLISTIYLDSWDSTGTFNPFLDCRLVDENDKYITVTEDGIFNIPLGASGVYIDYLFSNETYSNVTWWRCYINGVHGSYTLDELEKVIKHYSYNWDSICIIGIGTYTVDEVVPSGFIQSPNIENYNIVGWNYTRLKLKEYNTASAFINSNFKDNYISSLSITSTTTGSDISNNTDHDKKPEGSIFDINDYIKNTDFGFGYISSYITSIATNITSFNAMVIIVLGWLPEPILNLLCVSLMTFVSILFIKLILHLL